MEQKIYKSRIVPKGDTEANWNKALGFIPLDKEIIIYKPDENHVKTRIKIGDGKTTVQKLDFFSVDEEEILNIVANYVGSAIENLDFPQSNYEENDPNSINYIQNRPFYYEPKTGIIDYSYDGNSFNKDIINYKNCVLVKISDRTDISPEVAKQLFITIDDNDYSLAENNLEENVKDGYYISGYDFTLDDSSLSFPQLEIDLIIIYDKDIYNDNINFGTAATSNGIYILHYAPLIQSGSPADAPKYYITRLFSEGPVDCSIIKKLDAKFMSSEVHGDFSIDGNLTVAGTTITKDTETILVKDSFIVTNSDGISNPSSSGLIIRTGPSLAYGILYTNEGNGVKIGLGTLDSDGVFRYSFNQGQFLATRDDSITHNSLIKWDGTTRKLISADGEYVKSIAYSKDLTVQTISDGGVFGRVYIKDKNNNENSVVLDVHGTNYTIPIRNGNGNFYVTDPQNSFECVNKQYLQNNYVKKLAPFANNYSGVYTQKSDGTIILNVLADTNKNVAGYISKLMTAGATTTEPTGVNVTATPQGDWDCVPKTYADNLLEEAKTYTNDTILDPKEKIYKRLNLVDGEGTNSTKHDGFSQDALHQDYKHYTISYISIIYEKVIDPITSGSIIQAGSAILKLLKDGIEISSSEIESVMNNNTYEDLRKPFYETGSRKLPNDISILTNIEPDYDTLIALYRDYTSSNSTQWSRKTTAEEVDTFVYESIDSVFGAYVEGKLEENPNNANGTVSTTLGIGNTAHSPFAIAIGYGNIIGEKGNPHESAAAIAAGYKLSVKGISAAAFGKENIVDGDAHFVGGGNNNIIDEGARSAIVGGQYNEIHSTQAGVVAGQLNVIKEDSSGSVALGGNTNEIDAAKNCIIGGQYNVINDSTNSMAFGFNLIVPEGSGDQFVVGRYNNPDKAALFQVGYGNSSERKNALEVFSSGMTKAEELHVDRLYHKDANNNITVKIENDILWTDTLKVNTIDGAVKIEGNIISSGSIISGLRNRLEGNFNILGGDNNSITNTGHNNIVSGLNNITAGAVGNSNNIIAGKENTIGTETNAAERSLIVGGKNKVSNQDNIVGGYGNIVSTYSNLIVGDYNTIKDSSKNLVSGAYNLITHKHCGAIGEYLQTSAHNQFVIGKYNASNPDALFIVGKGDSDDNRINALTVLKDGRVKVYADPIEDDDAVRLKDSYNVVKKGIVTNTLKLTDEEKASACETIGAVPKTSTLGYRIYTSEQGQQTTRQFGVNANPSIIIQRHSNGGVKVPLTPDNNDEATSKQYVDDNDIVVYEGTQYISEQAGAIQYYHTIQIYVKKKNSVNLSDYTNHNNALRDIYDKNKADNADVDGFISIKGNYIDYDNNQRNIPIAGIRVNEYGYSEIKLVNNEILYLVTPSNFTTQPIKLRQINLI